MICPYCAHTFPLTWHRYWKALFGKHTCPSCGRKSRLSAGLGYWLWYVPLVTLLPVAGVLVGAFLYAFSSPGHTEEQILSYFESWLWVAALIVPSALILPIDRMIDERVRKLRPIHEEGMNGRGDRH